MKSTIVIIALVLGTPFAGAQTDTLTKIRTSGVATMGVRDGSIPLSFAVGDGKYIGFHVDVCTRILGEVQKQLGLKTLETRYQVVTSQNRIPLVQSGTVDIECGSTTNNAARQQQVAFALTTYVEEVRMAVKASSGIKSLKDLKGRTVVATTGTTSVQYLRRHERAAGLDIKELFGKDHAESFLSLESGRADAFVIDATLLKSLIASSKNPGDYAVVGEVLNVEPIAIMLPKNDPAFKKIADDTIRGMLVSGEIAELWNKWFMRPIPPRGININLPPPDSIRKVWAEPNDRPLEDFAAK